MGQQATLSDYVDDLRRLLHDPADRYWPLADKIVYINKGMQRRDLDTGANRVLTSVTLVAGQDTYDFDSVAVNQPNAFDVVSIAVIYGNLRVMMDSYAYSRLNVLARQFQPGLQFCPLAWARYGPNTVVFGPVPSQAYVTEWDLCIYTDPLVNLTDADPVVYPYTNAVPYYAAYQAKLNERQYDEAEGFKSQYDMQINTAVNARVGMRPSHYRGGVMWMR